MKIQDDVLNVLKKSNVDESNNVLFLPAIQLDRSLYVKVNKCLESLGGAWNRKLKGHVFNYNPSDSLEEMIISGEWTDLKKEYQFFRTPKELAKRMIALANIFPDDVLMEPEAGDGAILDEFPKANKYIAIELMKENVDKLKEKGYNVLNQDFLDYSGAMADKIVMNPPFSKQQDVKHIFHAWNLLKSKGILVSVVSESPFFRENSLSVSFRNWIRDNNVMDIENDSGTFKESGTMVKTRLVIAKKE